jgi:hypothetical protein
VDALRPFVNVADPADWRLLVAWLLGALRPSGPYPVLILHGEQGSAKSTTARVLRELCDPNSAPLRSEPSNERDLMIAATNGWMVTLDNLSRLPAWLSDALCRLACGGGFGTRELYSDADEIIFDAARPVLLTGIDELATRGDLLDRGVLLTLPPITDQARQPERGFWRAFYAAQPGILGALLTAVSRALADVGQIERTSLPRMADFALWVEAAAPALGWMPHTFLHDYNRNRADASDLPLEASPVAHLVRALAETGWKGAPSELLKHLNAKVDEADRKQRGWPTTARALSGQLRRLAPNLRAVGVNVQFGREAGGNRPRYIVLERIAEEPSQPSPSVPGGTQTRRRGTQTAPGGTQTTLPHVQQGRLGR